MKSWIEYFVNRPTIANLLFFGVLFMAVLLWDKIGKEEMPEFAMDLIRVQLSYPGAPAEDVEVLVTKPIEDELKGVSGIYEVQSTSAFGSSSLNVTLSPDVTNPDKVIQEIKDAVETAKIPQQIERPRYRQFSSSEKAIMDVALYIEDVEILDTKARQKLQEFGQTLETRLIDLPEIVSVEWSGYLEPELQVKVDPRDLKRFEISMTDVREKITSTHLRVPLGRLEDKIESEVSLNNELQSVEALEPLILRGGFEGQKVRLNQVGKVERGFIKSTTVNKIQGREALVINVRKSMGADIISATEAVHSLIERIQPDFAAAGVKLLIMDDESYDVRNRLSIIGMNGAIGFVLILLVLFVFLDFKSGFWVAMGIPFTLAFTLIISLLAGYTINNMTLAAIIIVLGIVVDDAIIVAENISRRQLLSGRLSKADIVSGTLNVFHPIVASILTTCAAFVPLYFFTGRFGLFVKYIPLVVFLMLAASLIESLFLLPSHLHHKLPGENFFNRLRGEANWIHTMEAGYKKFLFQLLRYRGFVLGGFIILLLGAGFLFQDKMKFVMFPREEATQFRVNVVGPPTIDRVSMAKKVRVVENIFLNDPEGVVVAVRTGIGQSHRGGESRENEASLRIEIVPFTERESSLNELLARWESQTQSIEGFEEIKFVRSRFGSDSGSAIDIEIRESDDERRRLVTEELVEKLRSYDALANVEIERPLMRREYQFRLKDEKAAQLGLVPSQAGATLQSYVEGLILYSFKDRDEEVDVRLSTIDGLKGDIDTVKSLPVANQGSYLVPLDSVFEVVEQMKPANITRVDFRRTASVYADLVENSNKSPLEIAEVLEAEVFPELNKKFPTSLFRFRGEIEQSRESQGDFGLALALVLILIYVLLVILFNSLTIPFVVGSVIPLGAVGVILAFLAHGMGVYGFFAVIGTLGMIGVVVNDAIVMISKFEESEWNLGKEPLLEQISDTASTRLRPVIVTTLTTVAGLFPTAYGLGGYDSMLAEMMLAMGWGLLFATAITLIMLPCLYSFYAQGRNWWEKS